MMVYASQMGICILLSAVILGTEVQNVVYAQIIIALRRVLILLRGDPCQGYHA